MSRSLERRPAHHTAPVIALQLTSCLALAFAGCASHTIPDHYGIAPDGAPVPGYYGQTVRVVTGGAVETIELDEGHPLNLQINIERPRQGEVGFPHELTIGRFSTWLGSGFARARNIYYRKRIDTDGVDGFEVDGVTYYLRWTMTSRDVRPGKAVFEVSVGRGGSAAPQ